MRNIVPLSGGDYFMESEYFHANAATGVLTNRVGRRLICLTEDFLRGFDDALREECGPAAAEVYISCGRMMGKMVGERIEGEISGHYKEPINKMTVAHFEACIRSYFSHHGWGKLSVDHSKMDEGLILIEVKNAIFQSILEKTDKPMESLLTGFLSGFFSHFSGQQLSCVQTQCQSLGHDSSLFILGLDTRMSDVPEWVDAKLPHHEILSKLSQIRI